MKTEGVSINLTTAKSEELFYNALCDADVLSGYDISLKTIASEYKKAKEGLIAKNKRDICREDVCMEILRNGGTLTLIDHEGDDEEYTISIKEVHERVQNTRLKYLTQAINEDGDGTTGNVILQTVFLFRLGFNKTIKIPQY